MDGRRFNGGARPGAGRKPKEDEDRIRTLSINALCEIYGSEENAFRYLGEKGKESFPHLRLLFEYAYGKPKEYREIDNLIVEQPLFPDPKPFPYHKLSDSALIEIQGVIETQ